jgi:hypothetical protein
VLCSLGASKHLVHRFFSRALRSLLGASISLLAFFFFAVPCYSFPRTFTTTVRWHWAASIPGHRSHNWSVIRAEKQYIADKTEELDEAYLSHAESDRILTYAIASDSRAGSSYTTCALRLAWATIGVSRSQCVETVRDIEKTGAMCGVDVSTFVLQHRAV